MQHQEYQFVLQVLYFTFLHDLQHMGVATTSSDQTKLDCTQDELIHMHSLIIINIILLMAFWVDAIDQTSA